MFQILSKAGKRKQNFQKFCQIINACRIELRVQEMTISEKLTIIRLINLGAKLRVARCSGNTTQSTSDLKLGKNVNIYYTLINGNHYQ